MIKAVYGDTVAGRITYGLLRLNASIRGKAWDWSETNKLTPTQGEILVLLYQRGKKLRLSDIHSQILLTAATTSDAVSTLETKGFVKKEKDKKDGRAIAISLTKEGRELAKKAAAWPAFLTKVMEDKAYKNDEANKAIKARVLKKPPTNLKAKKGVEVSELLSDMERETFFYILLKLIRQLEIENNIPWHRMCLTCKHFTPYPYSKERLKPIKAQINFEASKPHYCAAFNQTYTDSGIRMDCFKYSAINEGDDVGIDNQTKQTNWDKIFLKRSLRKA